MRANKSCPFCKLLLRKEIANFSKQYKLFCFKCKNKFTELNNVITFNYNSYKITINHDSIKIIDGNDEFNLHGKFDVYNNFSQIEDKIWLLIFK